MIPDATAAQGLLRVEAARDRVLADAAAHRRRSGSPTADALGRVAAEVVTARTSLPPWPNSAMDGYAILAADTAAADGGRPGPSRGHRRGAGRRAAGRHRPPGTAVRIATGARIPDGADAVVPVEATTPLDADDRAGPRGRDAAGPAPGRGPGP